MPQLNAGERTTVTVQIGGTLALGASVGANGSVVRLAASAGGEPFAPVVYSGAALSFGPYDEIARFAVQCDAGVLPYVLSSVASGVTNAYAGRYRKSVTSGRTTTVMVPAGSKLTIAASTGSVGYIAPSRALTPITAYSGSLLEVGPFSDTREYQVYCGYGVMALETAWAAAPGNTVINVSGGYVLNASGGFILGTVNG